MSCIYDPFSVSKTGMPHFGNPSFPNGEGVLNTWQLKRFLKIYTTICTVVVSKHVKSMSKRVKSMFHYRNSGSIKTCYVHREPFRYLKYLQESVPSHIWHIGIHFIHYSFCFSFIAFWTCHKKQPNFNLNYLSSMFLDLTRFDTTTTKYGQHLQ